MVLLTSVCVQAFFVICSKIAAVKCVHRSGEYTTIYFEQAISYRYSSSISTLPLFYR